MEPVCTFPPHHAVVIPLALSVFREGSKVPRDFSFPLALTKEGRFLRRGTSRGICCFFFFCAAASSAPPKPAARDRASMLIERTAEHGGDGAHFADEPVEFIGKYGLRPVGERVGRVVVDLDEDSVRADCDRRA